MEIRILDSSLEKLKTGDVYIFQIKKPVKGYQKQFKN